MSTATFWQGPPSQRTPKRTAKLWISLAFVALASPAAADPSGLWQEKGGDRVRVSRCGSGYCGRIASVNPPTDAQTGKPRTDKNNPDPARQTRPLVGLTVLTATRASGPGKWSGRLYDADRGQSFEATSSRSMARPSGSRAARWASAAARRSRASRDSSENFPVSAP